MKPKKVDLSSKAYVKHSLEKNMFEEEIGRFNGTYLTGRDFDVYTNKLKDYYSVDRRYVSDYDSDSIILTNVDDFSEDCAICYEHYREYIKLTKIFGFITISTISPLVVAAVNPVDPFLIKVPVFVGDMPKVFARLFVTDFKQKVTSDKISYPSDIEEISHFRFFEYASFKFDKKLWIFTYSEREDIQKLKEEIESLKCQLWAKETSEKDFEFGS
jgi:hypothetical protein